MGAVRKIPHMTEEQYEESMRSKQGPQMFGTTFLVTSTANIVGVGLLIASFFACAHCIGRYRASREAREVRERLLVNLSAPTEYRHTVGSSGTGDVQSLQTAYSRA